MREACWRQQHNTTAPKVSNVTMEPFFVYDSTVEASGGR